MEIDEGGEGGFARIWAPHLAFLVMPFIYPPSIYGYLPNFVIIPSSIHPPISSIYFIKIKFFQMKFIQKFIQFSFFFDKCQLTLFISNKFASQIVLKGTIQKWRRFRRPSLLIISFLWMAKWSPQNWSKLATKNEIESNIIHSFCVNK